MGGVSPGHVGQRRKASLRGLGDHFLEERVGSYAHDTRGGHPEEARGNAQLGVVCEDK